MEEEMAVELPEDAEGREIPYDGNGNGYGVHRYRYPVRRTVPHIEMTDDDSTAGRSVEAGCTECHAFAQVDHAFTGPFADGAGPTACSRHAMERAS